MKKLLRNVQLWAFCKPSPLPHVFITGAARSGTTPLNTILTRHDLIFGCDYESTGIFKIRDLLSYQTGEFSNHQIREMINNSDNGIIGFYDLLAAGLSSRKNGKLFVDKIWPNSFRLRFINKMFPNARWLHMVRDVRDCYVSARRHPNVPQGRSAMAYARYWKYCNRQIESKLSDSATMRIQYEKLVADPEGILSWIMDFLNLDYQSKQLDQSLRVTSIDKVTHHQRLSDPVNASSVGRFRDDLLDKDCQMIKSICGQDMRMLGYSW